MHVTTDLIVGTGLVTALLLVIFVGGSSEMQLSLASGLTGYLGRTALDNNRDISRKDEVK